MYVFDNCKKFIHEIEHYRWQEWKGSTGEDKNRKEKPVDKDDHLIECLGRILFQEPIFREMTPKYSNNGVISNTSLDPYN